MSISFLIPLNRSSLVTKSDRERLYSLWQLEPKTPEIGKDELRQKFAARLAKARFLPRDREEKRKTREFIGIIKRCNRQPPSKRAIEG
jgi:hypothetical protein